MVVQYDCISICNGYYSITVAKHDTKRSLMQHSQFISSWIDSNIQALYKL